ncbi:uncharacterized protein LOC120528459 isoform X2 [Polypterus senegalus]|uniref:uncharacterized protein LOC120528459 isoform X2 n=1 Tax=Polypterus senegalus TaxID=55291 RepID=UPI0019664E00|nr:uncharacterized protein LOC120528459 isoform X2 [Polypterus senegalus]
MASANEDGVDERTVGIKEEDCERLTPEDVCVKLEDHEERISDFKEVEKCKGVTAAIKAEDLNDFSVGLELQKHETEDIFKQEACEESPSSLKLWSTNTGRLATQENSAELKSELSESEEKITERNGREGEESSGSVGMSPLTEIGVEEREVKSTLFITSVREGIRPEAEFTDTRDDEACKFCTPDSTDTDPPKSEEDFVQQTEVLQQEKKED